MIEHGEQPILGAMIFLHMSGAVEGPFSAVELRDGWGGRSKKMQDALRSARTACLAELRNEAWSIGADAVIGVDLDYAELSGGGKSMTLLVASGTAVRLVTAPPAFAPS